MEAAISLNPKILQLDSLRTNTLPMIQILKVKATKNHYLVVTIMKAYRLIRTVPMIVVSIENELSISAEQSEPGYKSLKRTNIRWCLLAMACIYMLGNNFCYDSPGPLETQLEQQFNIDSTHYSLLYTVYSLPNMILPILGGILLDSMGIRVGLILFCVILTIG